MAALTAPSPLVVREPRPGDGVAVARLWRELWDVHESWGSYPGAKDARTYADVAERIERDARVRVGHPVLGRHVHLVAERAGVLVGQVEGWVEKHGFDATTPHTCEVRSLVVTRSAHHGGVGRALLATLARVASQSVLGSPTVLAAEVLERNPAQSFYVRVGYAPVAYCVRFEPDPTPVGAVNRAGCVARIADPKDALAVAMLDAALANRRRGQGDMRFDRPRQVDATVLGAIAAHLGRPRGTPPTELVVTDPSGVVRASATFVVAWLDPPFLPTHRALLARVSVDPAAPAAPLVAPLVELGRRLAARYGAPWLEVTDLPAPGGAMYDAALALGGEPWSRIVCKWAPPALAEAR
jgi:GNAT superfamily N-acetyltransferase